MGTEKESGSVDILGLITVAAQPLFYMTFEGDVCLHLKYQNPV